MRDSFDVRTLSVELSDSLSLLELGEYAEDLIKTGRYGTCHSTPLTFITTLSLSQLPLTKLSFLLVQSIAFIVFLFLSSDYSIYILVLYTSAYYVCNLPSFLSSFLPSFLPPLLSSPLHSSCLLFIL